VGQMKAYAEWAKDKGYLNDNYEPINPNASSMDYVDEFVKIRDKQRSSNMASSHLTNFINKPKETT